MQDPPKQRFDAGLFDIWSRLLGFPRLASPVIVMDQSFCAVIDYVPSLFQGYLRKAPRRMLDLKSFVFWTTVNLGGSPQDTDDRILFASLEKIKGTGPEKPAQGTHPRNGSFSAGIP